MKKTLSTLIVLIMILTTIFTLVACNNGAELEQAKIDRSEALEAYALKKLDDGYYTQANITILNGYVTTGIAAIDAAEDLLGVVEAYYQARTAIDSVKFSSKYTYDVSYTMSPNVWNPHTYKSTTDAIVTDYTANSLYQNAYLADGSVGLVPVMAAADPVDVSATYSADSKWGIASGETGRAFRIALNEDAVWDDGTPINADTYMYSMNRLLDPQLNNYRAGTGWTTGSTELVGAKAFFNSGKSGTFTASTFCDAYSVALDSQLIFALGSLRGAQSNFRKWIIDQIGEDRTAAQIVTVMKAQSNWGLGDLDATVVASMEGKTLAQIKADTNMNAAWTAIIDFWQTNPNEELDFFVIDGSYPEAEFEDVGIIKIDDFTFDLVFVKPMKGFYIKYNLATNWIVYEDLYEENLHQDLVTGVWSSTYGSSVSTYMGYGPYKLTKFILDQTMEFEKSTTWFGFDEKYADTYGTFEREIDGEECEQYQTTRIRYVYAKEISTREQMFLKGQLAAFGLNKALFDNYKTSDSLYFAKGAATYYGIIASDLDSLRSREATMNGITADAYNPETYNGAQSGYKNKTILSIKEFRQAMCYAMNRNELCAALMPGTTPAFSLFSDLILADPANGVAFNTLDSTKAAICEYWGVTYGEGGDFDDLDEAYNAITGYDINKARELVDAAVDIAIAQGLMSTSTVVSIEYCAQEESETERLWYETFKTQYLRMVQGTKLQGKLEYNANYTLGNTFGDDIRSGKCDTAWGFGWSGGEYDPYDLAQVYVDSALNPDGYQYDAWVDWSKTDITLNLDLDGEGAVEHTYTVVDWYEIVNGYDQNEQGLPNCAFGKVADSIRGEILAAIEKELLLNYSTIPFMTQGSAQLKSYKINYGHETYAFPMGFGGLRYITYNYTDAEWSAYIAQQGGTLTY